MFFGFARLWQRMNGKQVWSLESSLYRTLVENEVVRLKADRINWLINIRHVYEAMIPLRVSCNKRGRRD